MSQTKRLSTRCSIRLVYFVLNRILYECYYLNKVAINNLQRSFRDTIPKICLMPKFVFILTHFYRSILGLYTLYFFILFRFMRTLMHTTDRLWLYDIRNPDRILKLLNEISFARSLGLYHLEEDLFAKLAFIIRSSELLIKYTRPYGCLYNPDIVFEGPNCYRPSQGKVIPLCFCRKVRKHGHVFSGSIQFWVYTAVICI